MHHPALHRPVTLGAVLSYGTNGALLTVTLYLTWGSFYL